MSPRLTQEKLARLRVILSGETLTPWDTCLPRNLWLGSRTRSRSSGSKPRGGSHRLVPERNHFNPSSRCAVR